MCNVAPLWKEEFCTETISILGCLFQLKFIYTFWCTVIYFVFHFIQIPLKGCLHMCMHTHPVWQPLKRIDPVYTTNTKETFCACPRAIECECLGVSKYLYK